MTKKGWCQHSYTNGERVCADMALLDANRELTKIEPWIESAPYLKAHDYMQKFTGALSVPAYNDLFTTTQLDVILLFKRAAELAEKEND